MTDLETSRRAGRRVEGLLVAFALIVFVALGVASARHKSATVDEFAHLAAGVKAWKDGDLSLYDKTPPLGRMLVTWPALMFDPKIPGVIVTRTPEASARDPRGSSWWPWTFATDFMNQNRSDYGRMLMASRVAVLLCGAGLMMIVWAAARSLYGFWGGQISLFSAALSPVLLAHSRLVTTDLMAALFSLLFMLAMIAYLARPALLRLLLMTLALSAALLTKFTCLFFAPFALAAPLLALLWPEDEEAKGFLKAALHMLLIVFLCWLFVLLAYQGKSVKAHEGFTPASASLKPAAGLLSAVPLPSDFVFGLDSQLRDAETGEGSESYLLGQWREQGARHYYLVAVGVKEPIPALALFLAGLSLVLLRRPREPAELLLLFFIAAYFAAASLVGSLQIGVRYLLPIYPAAFIITGRLGRELTETSLETSVAKLTGDRTRLMRLRRIRGAGKVMAVLLLIWLAAENLRVHPHYLAYFNQFAGGPKNGHRFLLDSNLDWGQDLPGLKRWIKDHLQEGEKIDLAYFGHDDPARFGIRYDLPGRGSKNRFIAVSVQLLMGKQYPMTFAPEPVRKKKDGDPLWAEIEKCRNRDPVAVIGHTIFIFEKPERRP